MTRPFDRNASTAGSWNTIMVQATQAAPSLLFGVRLWTAVCLALYVAFWLQLDNAFWAGTSASVVCQPHLGASMRKGWFRMIGSVVGAVVAVALTALFPQNRAGFLLALALWGGLCASIATLLRNFATYAAALAGFTATIIAGDELGAVGGLNGEAFTLALIRVSEIWIGIICAGIVLAGTDFGGAPRRLADLLALVSSDIAKRFASMLASPSSATQTRAPRSELIRRVIALDPVIDEVLGESSRIRYHSPLLQGAVDSLLAALAGWRTTSARLIRLPEGVARQEADTITRGIPDKLWSVLRTADPRPWIADPSSLRRLCDAAALKLLSMPDGTPSLRLLSEQAARVLTGLSGALEGLSLLVADPGRAGSRGQRFNLRAPDWLPALVNAARALVTIGAAQIFWILTEWPSGALAMTWTSITVIVLAPRADEAYGDAVKFTAGAGLAAVCAAIVLFAFMPNVDTFLGFSIVLALYLIPVGAMMAQPWQAATFAAMAGRFIPLFGPANQMNYDPVQFYNNALAIVAGCGFAALSFRLLPPLSPGFRSRRLLNLTLRDLRRLATTAIPREDNWESRMYGRLAALPDQAKPLQRAQMVTALSVGSDIIRLRRAAAGFGVESALRPALEAFAQGNSTTAVTHLGRLDERLADFAKDYRLDLAAARARSQILTICDAVAQHREYFDSGA